jgi:catechol 2,3-dioxygenase-like lactoylglutathione lyase family enzyme
MKVPAFRVHGVRYQTRDVNRAVAFYTQHLGFELNHQQGPPSRASHAKVLICCSVDRTAQEPVRCRMANCRNLADGTDLYSP